MDPLVSEGDSRKYRIIRMIRYLFGVFLLFMLLEGVKPIVSERAYGVIIVLSFGIFIWFHKVSYRWDFKVDQSVYHVSLVHNTAFFCWIEIYKNGSLLASDSVWRFGRTQGGRMCVSIADGGECFQFFWVDSRIMLEIVER